MTGKSTSVIHSQRVFYRWEEDMTAGRKHIPRTVSLNIAVGENSVPVTARKSSYDFMRFLS
jgi:hypothetical protein